jgi:hypothetical protein
MSDTTLVRLKNLQGADEANCDGFSYRPMPDGSWLIPRRHLEHLTHVGGYFEAPFTRHSDAIESALSSLTDALVDADVQTVREVATKVLALAQN